MLQATPPDIRDLTIPKECLVSITHFYDAWDIYKRRISVDLINQDISDASHQLFLDLNKSIEGKRQYLIQRLDNVVSAPKDLSDGLYTVEVRIFFALVDFHSALSGEFVIDLIKFVPPDEKSFVKTFKDGKVCIFCQVGKLGDHIIWRRN